MRATRLLIILGTLALVPATASAHAIGIEAKLRADRVAVEAYFDDDTPAAVATVTVTAADGSVVVSGKTDAAGRWAFPAPPAGKYKVEVNAGDGHLASTTITIPVTTSATNATPAASAKAEESGVWVSEGLTRAETTGPRRLVMAAIGVALIGTVTWVARVMARQRARGMPEAVP